MIAYQICEKTKLKIQNDELTGRIHSVFNKSFNVITSENQLISVLSNEKSIAPLSILLMQNIDFLRLGIIQDMKVYFNNNTIRIKDINQNIDLENAFIWNPRPALKFNRATEQNILCKLRSFEAGIYEYGKLNGIAPLVFNIGQHINELKTFYDRDIPLDDYNLFIFKRFLKFINLIIEHDIDNVSDATSQIIGFGPGLTPSVDDFISGLMISFVYLYAYFNLDFNQVYRFNAKIIDTIGDKTTSVSEMMLKSSSCGETSEVVRRFMISLLTPSSNKKLTSNLKKVINYGHTSGTDTLCGIYVGFRIMVNVRHRRVLTYEK